MCAGPLFAKPTLVQGRPAEICCTEIGGQVYSVSRGPLRVVSLEDEWYEDVRDPVAVVEALCHAVDFAPDLLTFWQRLPDVQPRYAYHLEWVDLAVLPVTSYDRWWREQIKSRVRNQIRKSQKEGVVVTEAPFDDEFVAGMTRIFNETPVRQGRRFWHYGKDFATIKQQFSRFLFRERMIGAYYRGEMIGFMMLADAGTFALTGQILSSVEHRDKLPNNALIAKAVQLCEERGLPYLVYVFWSEDSLAEFKRRCGFQRTRIPRYYVPLSGRGRIALKCGMHRGMTVLLPPWAKSGLKRLRNAWHEMRAAAGTPRAGE
jgi:hypothetical protein